MPVSDEVRKLIEPTLKKLNISIFEIDYVKEGKDKVLRILLEKEEEISFLLDEQDLISDDNYLLDVASAGAEHSIDLNKFGKYINKYINVHLINAIEGENIYEGTLINVEDESISLAMRVKTRTKNITIKKSNIDRARLAIKF